MIQNTVILKEEAPTNSNSMPNMYTVSCFVDLSRTFGISYQGIHFRPKNQISILLYF